MTQQLYRDIMVDVETSGTDPSHNFILQIGAVRFDLKDKAVDASAMFNRCLYQTTPLRGWDPSTKVWWDRQDPEVMADILARSEDPAAVMQAFFEWVAQTPSDRPIRFWAKPTSFDWMFVASYFKQYHLDNPFKYWLGTDVRSYVLGRGHDPLVWEKDYPFQGKKHNALHDVIHQIRLVFNA